MSSILFKEESYRVIGICMEINKTLGMGLKEINYKDTMQLEFQENNIPYEREKRFEVTYKEYLATHMLQIFLYSIRLFWK